ncbi:MULTISPECIES: hypothetical protein [Salegentibacter]|jgi:hypothetical protein|uniref:Dihydroorotase n=1 Tax=Salegentibacter agarivorans TaxID=345907 RepID=A0A1I2MQ93_9FLAO|nr:MULTISPECIES: hypothetical protein [Salegentibacter]APS40050.1 hypothetical protein AO058_14705 [Salegentibacter sp. T436]SFF91536.1 hypothetical protein SAMN04488033_11416 [Salegentibacter agarivorans]
MRNLLIIPIMLLFAFQVEAQNQTEPVTVGDVLVINQTENQNFKSLDLPKANFIIKKGGIANYKSLNGNRVEVTAVETNDAGETTVKLKREDGRKFFRTHTTISANIDEALENGELIL